MSMPRVTPQFTYNGRRASADMVRKGWNATRLASVTGLSPMTISRFLSGVRQTPRTAFLIAHALGETVDRYLKGRTA